MRAERRTIWRGALGAAALAALLAGCGEKADEQATGQPSASAAKVQRQPGSWTSKVEIVKLEGPGLKGGERQQMQAMMDMMASKAICLTPEAAAQDDPAKTVEQLGGQDGACRIDRKNISGGRIDFARSCTRANGVRSTIEAKGVSGATSQDITISTVATGADGKAVGEVVMRVTSTRTGECQPGDLAPPAPPAKAAS